MSGGSLYCRRCQKYVPMNGNVGDYRCPTCGSKTKIGDGPSTSVHREARRNDDASMEISLRESSEDPSRLEASLIESFKSMGLSEIAAKQAAKGRGMAEVPDTDPEKLGSFLIEGKLRDESEDEDGIVHAAVSQLLLEDSFIDSGMSEVQAREAARGRDGLGDAVMDVFRKARQTLKSAEDLEGASVEDHFRDMGLSETAAKQAAKGRR
jgi:hypothetical protein